MQGVDNLWIVPIKLAEEAKYFVDGLFGEYIVDEMPDELLRWRSLLFDDWHSLRRIALYTRQGNKPFKGQLHTW